MLRRIQRSMFGDRDRWIVILLVGAGLVVLAACHKPATNSNQSPPVTQAPPETAHKMPPVKNSQPDLGWTTTSEQHVRLSDYQNKVLVLDFYATWCEPCRDSVPHLVELQKKYGPVGLQVIGLNVGGPADLDDVPAFAREFHIQYQLGNPDPELASLYMGGEGAIPLTVVLDRQGRQVMRFVGYDASVDQELEEVIQKSLAVKAMHQSVQ